MNYCPNCSAELKSYQIEGVERLKCSTAQCSFVHWNNPVPVVMALVQYNEQYIVAHNVVWPEGIYSFITGYVDEHELPDQAVLREVKEELGLEATLGRFLGHYMFKEKNQLIIAYEVIANGSLKLNHELSDVLYLSFDGLSQYNFGPLYITRQVLKEWMRINVSP